MTGIYGSLRTWWSKDKLERADEGTRMTKAERDVAEEDGEAQKDDVAIKDDFDTGGVADYEADSEPPR